MRLNFDTTTGLVGLCATQTILAWMRTLDARVAYYDRALDPSSDNSEHRIYIFWHENILLPLFYRGWCGIATLMSQHRDADVLVRMAELLGFECVRGSSFRGGSAALKQLVSVADRSHIAITPDGPRGPRRHMAPGAIFLAAKLGMPIVPIGVGYDRPWRLKSWDRAAAPLPFSRARAILGPPLRIPSDSSREALEYHRERVELLLTQLSDEAEAWAMSRSRKQDEVTLLPRASTKGVVSPACKLHVA